MSGFDYRHILDVFADAVLVGDRTGRIVYLNRSAERLLDWSSESLVGQPITAIVPAALRGRHTAGFNRYRATRAARLIGREVRVPVLRRNGTEIRVELSLASFRGAAGEELYVASLRSSGQRNGAGERVAGSLLLSLLGSPLGASNTLDPEALVREALRIATATLGALQARLWLHDPEAGELHLPGKARPSPELGEPANGRIDLLQDPGTLAEAGRTGRLVHRRAPWEELGVDPAWARHHQVETALAVPLVHSGSLQGVLAFFAGQPASEELLSGLRLFSLLLAAALRGRELELLRRHRDRSTQEVEAYREVVGRIAAHEPSQAVHQRILALGLELTGADEGSLLRIDRDRQAYVVQACAGYKTPITGLLVPFGTGLTHEVASTGAPVRIDDYQRYLLAVPRIRQRGVRAALGVPIRSGSTLHGALKLETKKPDRTFSPEDERIAAALADLASLAWAPE